jgi:hypothetical protein
MVSSSFRTASQAGAVRANAGKAHQNRLSGRRRRRQPGTETHELRGLKFAAWRVGLPAIERLPGGILHRDLDRRHPGAAPGDVGDVALDHEKTPGRILDQPALDRAQLQAPSIDRKPEPLEGGGELRCRAHGAVALPDQDAEQDEPCQRKRRGHGNRTGRSLFALCRGFAGTATAAPATRGWRGSLVRMPGRQRRDLRLDRRRLLELLVQQRLRLFGARHIRQLRFGRDMPQRLATGAAHLAAIGAELGPVEFIAAGAGGADDQHGVGRRLLCMSGASLNWRGSWLTSREELCAMLPFRAGFPIGRARVVGSGVGSAAKIRGLVRGSWNWFGSRMSACDTAWALRC